MAVLVGIDEAGYGPILGPLVVSAAAFELPDDLIDSSLWEILAPSVCRSAAGSSGRIIINDSKKLKQTHSGYTRLQRGVLTCLTSITAEPDPPATLGRLLGLLDANCSDELARYPWYGLSLHDSPLRFDRRDITTGAAALANDMQEHDICLHGLWARPLFAGRFNDMVRAVDNKASVLFSLTSQLIDQAYRRFTTDNLQIVIDKQGGRSHYRRNLQRLFPHLTMKILKESDTTSSYHLAEPGRGMRIHFLAKGEDRQLPIALASMISKYLRELFMELLNAYFARHCPEISPTAGYYKDGKRFLNDLHKANLPAELAPNHLLVRQR